MKRAGRGSIVYIGSAAATAAVPRRARPTSLSKIGAARADAAWSTPRCAPTGIRANELVVKIVDTPRNRAENPDADFSRWTTGAELADVDRVAVLGRVRAALGRHDPRLWPGVRRAGDRRLLLDQPGRGGFAGRPRCAAARGRSRPGRACIEPAAIAVVDGRIAAVGQPDEVRAAHADLDGGGRPADGSPFPGLIDCHTHPAFGGDRADEFDLRAQGADYERIHAEGGGIAATVAATRALGRDGLERAASAATAAGCGAHGTTTAEGKSGYGLDHDTELAMPASGRRRAPDRDRARPSWARTRCRPSSPTATPTSTS